MSVGDVPPGIPTRRMIAVSVFIVGLIGPTVILALLSALSWPPGVFGTLVLLMLAWWMTRELRELWRGSYRAYQNAIVLFAVGTAFSLVALYPAAVSGGIRALAFPGASVLYFAGGLGTLVSAYGSWLAKK